MDTDNIFNDARAALPLPELMKAKGDGHSLPRALGGEQNPQCPFCKERGGKFGVYSRNERWFFKCQRTSCEANMPPYGHSEIGYIALRDGLSAKDAAIRFLELALPTDDRVTKRKERHQKASAPESQPKNPSREIQFRNPWHNLWQKLILSADDRPKLRDKRGFSDATIEMLGFASSTPANKLIVEGMTADFPEMQLTDLGILKPHPNNKAYASGQLIGWGNTGKKDERGNPVFEPGINPVLIPYYDLNGTIRYIRPHKGGLKNAEQKQLKMTELLEDDEEGAGVNAHVYFPPNFADLLEVCDGHAVFTEGEFKVGALAQCEIAALCTPGIQMIANASFRAQLLRYLRSFGVQSLTIIFDNELKSDPMLPGYVADPWKQHDTVTWAIYMMEELWSWARETGGSVMLGKLPDEHRDEKGKADFDGILAKMVSKHGLIDGTKQARKIFLKTISTASADPFKSSSDMPLLPGDQSRIVQRRLWMLQKFKRRIPYGNDETDELAARFSAWDEECAFSIEPLKENETPKPHPVDKVMADAFRAVRGCYYERKQIYGDKKERERVVKVLLPEVEGKISAARERKDYKSLTILNAYRRAMKERLKGIPTPISTFVMRAEFRIRDEHGDSARLVRFFNSRDPHTKRKDRPLLTLSSDDSAQPADFKKWMLKCGHGNWLTGEGPLAEVNADLDDEVHLKEIHSISHFGYHKETGIWFAEDSAFRDNREKDADGKTKPSFLLKPDENDVFWHESVGYRFDKPCQSREKPAFMASRPTDSVGIFQEGGIGTELAAFCAQPEFQIPDTKEVRDLIVAAETNQRPTAIREVINLGGSKLISLPHPVTQQLENKPVHEHLLEASVRAIIRHLKTDLPSCIGGLDAWMIIGALAAYACGPHLRKEYNILPGLFFVGEKGSGKTDTAVRLLRLWGYSGNTSKDVTDLSQLTTANAISRELQAASCWPIVFDEYRKTSQNAGMIDAVLRTATQGTSAKKATNTDRTTTNSVTPRTSPIVCGETSSGDAATASRYITVTFATSRHKEGSLQAWERVKLNACEYHHFGFWLMMNRLRFEREMEKALKDWQNAGDVRENLKDPRIATTIGIAHSAFKILCSMLSVVLSESESTEFRQFCISHGKTSTENVRVQSFRHRFWQDLISGLNRPQCGIGPAFFGEKYITIKSFARDAECTPEMLRTALKKDGDYAVVDPNTYGVYNRVRVVFIAMESVYDEWTRDLAQRREQVPISLQNLKGEMEQEKWYFPAPKKRGKHVQRLKTPAEPDDPNEPKSKPVACWCISIQRNYNPDGSPGEFDNPFAEDLINALGLTSDTPAL